MVEGFSLGIERKTVSTSRNAVQAQKEKGEKGGRYIYIYIFAVLLAGKQQKIRINLQGMRQL